jgi:hypothetical protein
VNVVVGDATSRARVLFVRALNNRWRLLIAVGGPTVPRPRVGRRRAVGATVDRGHATKHGLRHAGSPIAGLIRPRTGDRNADRVEAQRNRHGVSRRHRGVGLVGDDAVRAFLADRRQRRRQRRFEVGQQDGPPKMRGRRQIFQKGHLAAVGGPGLQMNHIDGQGWIHVDGDLNPGGGR